MSIYPTIVRPTSDRPLIDVAELWACRGLLYILIYRIIKVRYQQTLIGLGWAVLQPLMLTVVMSFIFGWLVKVPTDGVPYPIFVLTGLVVWQFVANALQQASVSIVLNSHLVTRIYFPRILLPLAAILAAVFDLACASLLMFMMLMWYGMKPTLGILAFMPMLIMTGLLMLGLSLWFGALYVKFRDVGYLLPFLVQLWMFASPVIYPTTLLPKNLEYLYALNPISVMIDTSRWAFVATAPPALLAVAIAVAVSVVMLVSGLWFFRRHEGTFADIV